MLEGGCSPTFGTGFGWGDLPTSGVKVAPGASEKRGGVVLLRGGPVCKWGVSHSLLLLCEASWECQASSGGGLRVSLPWAASLSRRCLEGPPIIRLVSLVLVLQGHGAAMCGALSIIGAGVLAPSLSSNCSPLPGC